MPETLDLISFQQACGQASPPGLESLAATLLRHLIQTDVDEASSVRQAAIPLVNQLIRYGMMGVCFQVVKGVTDRFDAPELLRLRTDLSRHLGVGLLKQPAELVQNQTGHFLSAILRPVRAFDHGLVADGVLPEGITIVMQGPILLESDFTLESLRLYTRMFPGVRLVLSTWDSDPVEAIAKLLPDVHIVQNRRPDNPGPSNINMQIVSAREGIRFACEALHSRFVLKTRTDMRLYNPNALLDMLALLDQFPCKSADPQRARLVVISDVVKYMHYAVPDKTMFGSASDMWTYWSLPLDERPAGAVPSQPTMRTYAQQRPAEVYLLRQYLQRVGWQEDGTLEDHFRVLRDLFVVYDRSAADLYWPKYAHQLEFRFKQYGHNQMLEEFGFNDWLRLQSARYRPYAPEVILDTPQSASLSELLTSALSPSALN